MFDEMIELHHEFVSGNTARLFPPKIEQKDVADKCMRGDLCIPRTFCSAFCCSVALRFVYLIVYFIVQLPACSMISLLDGSFDCLYVRSFVCLFICELALIKNFKKFVMKRRNLLY